MLNRQEINIPGAELGRPNFIIPFFLLTLTAFAHCDVELLERSIFLHEANKIWSHL